LTSAKQKGAARKPPWSLASPSRSKKETPRRGESRRGAVVNALAGGQLFRTKNLRLLKGHGQFDIKVDAANWPPSPRIPLKHHFRSIQILAPFILVGDHRQHSHPGHAILEVA
jgi:hypothetical protein